MKYSEWSQLMKIKLQACRLWEAIDLGDVEPHDDCVALDALTNAVPADMVSSILGKASARTTTKYDLL